ncbi:MAG: hypothetical protein OEM96_08820 [Gemmatimonadota bacterium]|nr:hypothetical protein [Gemmatimonadota bacterium]
MSRRFRRTSKYAAIAALFAWLPLSGCYRWATIEPAHGAYAGLESATHIRVTTRDGERVELGAPIAFDDGILVGMPREADENALESRHTLAAADIARLQERRFDATPVIALVGLGAVLLIGMIEYNNSSWVGN